MQQCPPPRIPPLDLAEASDEQKQLLEGWEKNLNCCRVIAHHPELYKVFFPLIEKTIPRTDLPPRDRQILVLRTLALCDEVYELAHHRSISYKTGMTDADVDAAIAGSESLSPWERTLARAAEELVRDKIVSDATWAAMAERYSRIELMEAVGVVAAYTALAMMFKSYGVQLEDAETFGGFKEDREYT